MRGFVQRALKKIQKLDPDQLYSFIQDLAKEHEQLGVVMDSLTEGVMVADIRNNLIFLNKAAERLLPIATCEIFGHPLWEALLDRDISGLVRDTLVGQESVQDREFALDDTGDRHRILSITITPLVQNGRIQGSILIARDVSEKRIREARLRRAESLASLTTLTAGVAHEIKNPLGSIGIHIQLIQKILARATCEYPREINTHLEVVNEEVERLNRIVMDFLFAVRPMHMDPAPGDLNQTIQDLVAFLGPELEGAQVQADTDLDPSLPLVLMDERLIKQALLNLIKNAMAAMPEGGNLRVSTQLRDRDVAVALRDTGVGMTREVQEKIFEPFFTTRDFGSGIGLTLVYKIVREHGGEISVQSTPGRGSTFILTLPVVQGNRPLLCWDENAATVAGCEDVEGDAPGLLDPGLRGQGGA